MYRPTRVPNTVAVIRRAHTRVTYLNRDTTAPDGGVGSPPEGHVPDASVHRRNPRGISRRAISRVPVEPGSCPRVAPVRQQRGLSCRRQGTGAQPPPPDQEDSPPRSVLVGGAIHHPCAVAPPGRPPQSSSPCARCVSSPAETRELRALSSARGVLDVTPPPPPGAGTPFQRRRKPVCSVFGTRSPGDGTLALRVCFEKNLPTASIFSPACC